LWDQWLWCLLDAQRLEDRDIFMWNRKGLALGEELETGCVRPNDEAVEGPSSAIFFCSLLLFDLLHRSINTNLRSCIFQKKTEGISSLHLKTMLHSLYLLALSHISS
jgi:hypothetical protein